MTDQHSNPSTTKYALNLDFISDLFKVIHSRHMSTVTRTNDGKYINTNILIAYKWWIYCIWNNDCYNIFNITGTIEWNRIEIQTHTQSSIHPLHTYKHELNIEFNIELSLKWQTEEIEFQLANCFIITHRNITEFWCFENTPYPLITSVDHSLYLYMLYVCV